MKALVFLLLAVISFQSFAVVKRHDISPQQYVLDKPPEYLIDMPHEGHGVLISPHWILTVAHTIFYDYVGKTLNIGSAEIEIEQVHIHPNYTVPDKALFKGDARPLMNLLKSRSDIALIKLASPVVNRTPIKLYTNSNEKNKEIMVFGRGVTGNGITGENVDKKPVKELNHFKNIIETAEGNWLSFKFDAPPNALPLEGMHGSGDSGGASVIYEDGTPYLVGLSSWQMWQGNLEYFKGGLYGTTAYQVRVSKYQHWITSVLNNE